MSLHEDEDNQAGMKPMLEVPLEEADREATGKDGIIPAHDDVSHIEIAMKAEVNWEGTQFQEINPVE